MRSSYIKQLFIFLLVCFVTTIESLAQLPECDKVYLDQMVGDVQNQRIYVYDPALPISATNPSLNSISLPPAHGGFAISPVLGSGNPTETFYTTSMETGTYFYFDPITSTWVNTGHPATNGLNLAAGGGYIFSLDGPDGTVARYNGIAEVPVVDLGLSSDMAGPYDLIADCEGNFYILRINYERTVTTYNKYNYLGEHMQSWNVVFPYADGIPSGGFAGFDTVIYTDRMVWNDAGVPTVTLVKAVRNVTNLVYSGTPISLPQYPTGTTIGDMASCSRAAVKLPEITINAPDSIQCDTLHEITATSLVLDPPDVLTYQWYKNGVAVPGGTGSTYTFLPANGDNIYCTILNEGICSETEPIIYSNDITIHVGNHGEYFYDTTVCKDVTFMFGDILVSTPGLYEYDFVASTYCDSMVHLNVSYFDNVTHTSDNFIGCDSVSVNGVYYYQSTTIRDTIKAQNSECDSIIHAQYIHVNKSYNDTLKVSICRDDFYLHTDGNRYTRDTMITSNRISIAGCDSMHVFWLEVMDRPDMAFIFEVRNEDDMICRYDSVYYIPTGATYYRYYDQFGDYVGAGDSFAYVLTYPENNFMIIGAYENGCTDTLTSTLYAEPCCDLIIPNAFTPNGDGLNDYFGPVTYGNPEKYVFMIYDRWGNQMFISYNVDNKWNGRYIDGTRAPSDVYFYILRGTCADGTPVVLRGDVTLVD